MADLRNRRLWCGLLAVTLLLGCSSYRRAYCKHCWLKEKLGKTGDALVKMAPDGDEMLNSMIDDAIDGAFDDDDRDDKEIRRDTRRHEDGRSLRYHDNAADLRWHRQEQATEGFDWDDDDDL
jgi:hypothetical protein